MADETPAKIYRLDQGDGDWFALWRQYAPRQLIQAALLCGGLGALFVLFRYPEPLGQSLLIMGPVLVAVFVVAVALNLRSFRMNFPRLLAYELQLDPDRVIQRMPDLPEQVIRREEVTRLVESRRYGLFIQTADSKRRIVILPQMQDYADIRAHLAGWMAIQSPGRLSLLHVSRGTVNVVFIVALAAAILGQTPIVVLPGAIATLSMIGYSIVVLIRHAEITTGAVVQMGMYLLLGLGVCLNVIQILS